MKKEKNKMNEKIELKNTTMTAIIKMSEGNPGALTVCLRLLKEVPYYDPDNIMEGLGVLLLLDTLGIYGSRIWMFYKDFCKENIGHVILVMRAYQLGIITQAQVDTAIDNMGAGIDINNIGNKVKAELPNFNFVQQ
jgi:hypothetical protein